MDIIDIGLIVEDIEYGRALCTALALNQRNLSVKLYEKNEDLAFEGAHDIIVCDRKIQREINYVRLSEKKAECEQDPEERSVVIYKYSSVKSIAAAILDAYSIFTGRKVISVKRADVNILVFCSWQGGCGCTSVSMAMAQEMKRFYGRKVLYISLEEIESTALYMKNDPDKGTLSEYLYYLFYGKEKVCRNTENFLVTDTYGIKAFCPTAGRNPLKQLKKEEFIVFMNSVIESGIFTDIILDAGNSAGDTAGWACGISQKTCVVFEEENGNTKKDSFIKALISSGIKDTDYHPLMICNKYLEKEEKEEAYETAVTDENAKSYIHGTETESGALILEFDPESFEKEEGLRMIHTDRGLGAGIRQLHEKLFRLTQS